MEHSQPAWELIEHMTLPSGAKSVTVPKVGQFEMADLIDSVDLEDEQEIGMTTTDLTTGEVGAKIILTDKLVRQSNPDVFKIVGKQFGDAAGRKKCKDVVALYSGLNGGTALGADNKNLSMANAAACIAYAKAHKFGKSHAVHHPNAIYQLSNSAAVTPSATYPIPHGFSEELLRDFWSGIRVSQVPFFECGEIEKVSGQDSGYGFIGHKEALVGLMSKGFDTERERDASLRATELVCVADYGCFELDDSMGAPLLYEIGDVATNA